MRYVIAERTSNGCTATLLFDTGGPVGSDHLLIVTPVNADAEWVINRWFYFDEQAEPYMWNFAEKVCSDPEYRRESLEGHTDWARVATRYESLARRLYDELAASDRSEFPIMTDDSREDSARLTSICEEVFDGVRAFIRQDTAPHPDEVYLDAQSELRQWLRSDER